MENTEIADLNYHYLLALVVIVSIVLLVAILRLERWLSFVEKLVLGLWVGFIAADVAVLASALPYIYTQPDNPMRCGALGISTFAIAKISDIILIIVLFAVIWSGGRAWVSKTIRKHGPAIGLFKDGAIIGLFLWCGSVFTGSHCIPVVFGLAHAPRTEPTTTSARPERY
jgi:hypothetical protein